MELAPGTEVDRYVVEELLGRGGMAAVYRVRDRELGGVFALKVLDVPSRSVRERLLQEGSIQQTLRHPNVVAVIGSVVLDGAPALLLEYVDGPTLESLLRVHRPTLAQIDELADGILLGVRAAHRHGLVHRDLKPANVLLQRADDGFVPKIADFGLARLLDTDAPSTTRTRTGAVLGTPAYMAPEQFRSAAVDARADVYALGVTLYELVTGERPYDATDLFALADQVRSGGFVRPREKVPELPERMEAAILGALQVDPEARWPDVDAMRAAWRGRAEAPDDRDRAWDRALLDSMSRSGGGGSASDRPKSQRSGRDAQTWASEGASLAGGSREGRTPARTPSLARRSAPLVAVLGLSLAVLLGVGVVGGGAAVMVGTRAGAPPPVAEPAAVEIALGLDAAPAPAPAAEPAPAPAPSPRPAARAEPTRSAPPLADAPAPMPAATPAPVRAPTAHPPPPGQAAPAEPLVGWSVLGDARAVELRAADGRVVPLGAVPPAGAYTLVATFPSGAVATLAVRSDGVTPQRFACVAARAACTPR